MLSHFTWKTKGEKVKALTWLFTTKEEIKPLRTLLGGIKRFLLQCLLQDCCPNSSCSCKCSGEKTTSLEDICHLWLQRTTRLATHTSAQYPSQNYLRYHTLALDVCPPIYAGFTKTRYFSLLPSQIISCQILYLKSALKSLHFTALTGVVVGAVQCSHPLLEPVVTEKGIVLALRSHQALSSFLPPSWVRDSRRGFQSSYLLNWKTLQLQSGKRKCD